MSIALDFALLIRDSSNKFNLSLATIGAGYTLAFRIGSNAMSWVSQKTLAEEMGVSESNVRIHCNKLKAAGILKTKKDTKDKRKYEYRFSIYVVNYHQLNEAERKKCRLKLGDSFEDTAYFQAVDSAYKQAVLLDAQTPETPVPPTLNEDAQIPKGKEKETYKSKDTSIAHAQNAQNRFDEFWNIYPLRKDKQRAMDIWKRNKYDKIALLIFEDIRKRILNEQQWKNEKFIPYPSTYLRNKRWEDDLTITKSTNSTSEKFNPAQYVANQIKEDYKRGMN